jgi:hypothetical protein
LSEDFANLKRSRRVAKAERYEFSRVFYGHKQCSIYKEVSSLFNFNLLLIKFSHLLDLENIRWFIKEHTYHGVGDPIMNQYFDYTNCGINFKILTYDVLKKYGHSFKRTLDNAQVTA